MEGQEELTTTSGVDFYLKCTPTLRIAQSCLEEASAGLSNLPVLEFLSGTSENAFLIRGLLLDVPRASIEQLYLVDSSFRLKNLNASCLTSPFLQRLCRMAQIKDMADGVTHVLDKAFGDLAGALPDSDRDWVPTQNRKSLVHIFFGQTASCSHLNHEKIPSLPNQKDLLKKAIIFAKDRWKRHGQGAKRQKLVQINDVNLARTAARKEKWGSSKKLRSTNDLDGTSPEALRLSSRDLLEDLSKHNIYKITDRLAQQYADAFLPAFNQKCTGEVLIENLVQVVGPEGETHHGHYYDQRVYDRDSPMETLYTYVCKGCTNDGAHALFCEHCRFRGQTHETYYDTYRLEALHAKNQKAKSCDIPPMFKKHPLIEKHPGHRSKKKRRHAESERPDARITRSVARKLAVRQTKLHAEQADARITRSVSAARKLQGVKI
jgi:hypothetical protein